MLSENKIYKKKLYQSSVSHFHLVELVEKELKLKY